MKLFSTLAFILFFQINVFAQACCSSGAPVASNLATFSLEGKGWSARIINDNIILKDLVSESKKLDNNNRTRTTRTLMTRVAYTFKQRWSVLAMLPWVWQKEENKFNTTTNVNLSSGIGDFIISGRYQPIKTFNTGLAIAMGIKFSNGVTDNADLKTGITLNPDMQPGSGSTDGLVILQFDKFISANFWLHIFMNYRITSSASRFNNTLSYEFGDEFQSYFGLSKPFSIKNVTLRPSTYLRLRHTSVDLTTIGSSPANDTPNTGGLWLHLVPQIQIDITPQLGFDLRTEFPIYRNLNGTQLTISSSWRVAVFYRLNNQAKPLNEY